MTKRQSCKPGKTVVAEDTFNKAQEGVNGYMNYKWINWELGWSRKVMGQLTVHCEVDFYCK